MVGGIFCPDAPGQVTLDDRGLHYAFDIVAPGTSPAEIPEKRGRPFEPSAPAELQCMFAIADAVYAEVEGADELFVTLSEQGTLLAEVQFSRALYKSLDAMRFLFEFGHDYHEVFDGGHGTKEDLWEAWREFVAKIPAERRREGGGFIWAAPSP